MIKNIHQMPVIDLGGNSLANTNHVWNHGGIDYTYKRNTDGYRSENFYNNPQFLFIGCSETFGESAEYDTTWAYKLFNMVKSSEDGYCNLGLPGIDVSLVIYHTLLFIEKYGKPKNIFALFPQFNRLLEANEKSTSSLILDNISQNKKDKLDNIEYVDERIIDSVTSSNLMQIKNFEMFCNVLGINLIWSTWCQKSGKKVIEQDITSNYINLVNEKNVYDFAVMFNKDIDSIEITRSDGTHHGEIFHDFWAKCFYNRYIGK